MASSTKPKPKLTLEAFLARPETKPYAEYIDGKVVRKPMPTTWHGMIQGLLSFVFTLYLRAHPIRYVGPEIRCIFGPPGGERAYVPDFVFVRTEGGTAPPTNEPLRGAPDLAVEILSPTDRMMRVRQKVRFYLEHGVRLVWIVDPERRTVMVMTSPEVTRILTEDDTLDGGDVPPDFSTPVRDILPPASQPS